VDAPVGKLTSMRVRVQRDVSRRPLTMPVDLNTREGFVMLRKQPSHIVYDRTLEFIIVEIDLKPHIVEVSLGGESILLV